MNIFTAVKCAIFTNALIFLSPSAMAVPITFEFSGTVTDEILSYGNLIKVDLKHPYWLGRSITGKFVVDVEGLEMYPNQAPIQVHYASYIGNNRDDFVTFSLTNPNGKSYSFPGDLDKFPTVDVDAAVASLTYYPNSSSNLFIDRVHTNLHKAPRQDISLRLSSQILSDQQVINGLDFNNLFIDVQYANFENYGWVDYNNGKGDKFIYYFTINSITRLSEPTDVPEPASWSLGLFAIGAAFFCRRLRQG